MPQSPATVLVIIPARNEAANLAQVLSSIAELGLSLDVLVVDDRSTDQTPELASRLGARVLRLSSNLGYGGAVQAGFRYALHYGYGHAVIMDADGQHSASCIPDLLAAVKDGRGDIAVGSRFLGRMEYRAGLVKQVGMAFFSQIVSRITHRRITDATSGFQAMTRDVIAFLAEDNYPTDFPDADTLLLLHFAGFRLCEVPVVMRERLSGESMHSSWKPFYYVAKMLLSIFIVLLRHKTLKNGLRSDHSGAMPTTSA
jgi:glycosyltransferase involved in cell wall biosynthesis